MVCIVIRVPDGVRKILNVKLTKTSVVEKLLNKQGPGNSPEPLVIVRLSASLRVLFGQNDGQEHTKESVSHQPQAGQHDRHVQHADRGQRRCEQEVGGET